MIRGLFIEKDVAPTWKNVPLQGLINLVGDNLYLRHNFKDKIVVISNKARSKFFVCQYRLGRFASLSADALAN